MNPLLAAFRFLTVLPIPGTWGTAEADLSRSVPLFPVVGLLLGLLAAVIAWTLSLIAPPMVMAVGVTVALMGFSGCMHLDGLADTADGFLSSRGPERILEIMKDSHVGAMGVIASVVVVLAKFAALGSLSGQALWSVVLLMPLAGRCALVVHMALLPYTRPNGLVSVFYQQRHTCAAAWWAIGLFALVSWSLLGIRGLAVWLACMVVMLLLAVYARRKIGGATGDTLGAACEILELVPACVLAILSWEGGK